MYYVHVQLSPLGDPSLVVCHVAITIGRATRVSGVQVRRYSALAPKSDVLCSMYFQLRSQLCCPIRSRDVTRLRLQEEPWPALLKQLPQFQRLWPLPEPSSKGASPPQPVIDLLSRIEDPQLIRILTSPQHHSHTRSSTSAAAAHVTLCDTSESIFYYLPRFNLRFELRAGSDQLRSCDFSGYCVATKATLKRALGAVGPHMQQLAPLPLPLLFNHFIVLIADEASNTSGTMPLKVVIPDAKSHLVEGFGVKNVREANVHHHVFDFHPYIGNLETPVVQSRLYLAALHAQRSCAVPLAGLRMTGGEHALQLLRQTWVNRPLADAESAMLNALTAAAAHTPALRLLCGSAHAYSVSLRFLYRDPPKQLPLDHEQWLEENMPSEESAQAAYRQEVQRSGALSVRSTRRALSEQDAREVMTNHVNACTRKWGQYHAVTPPDVQWNDLQGVGSWQRCAPFCKDAFVCGAKHGNLQLMEALTEACLTQDECHPDEHALIEQLTTDVRSLGSSQHEQEMAEQCQHSLEACKASAGAPQLQWNRVQEVGALLEQSQGELKSRVDSLAVFLLDALAFCPRRNRNGSALRVYQVAGMATQPALADLILVTTQEGLLQV